MRKVPGYYPTMYLDGFSPDEILHAHHQTMLRQIQEREAQRQEMEEIGAFKIISEVKVKK